VVDTAQTHSKWTAVLSDEHHKRRAGKAQIQLTQQPLANPTQRLQPGTSPQNPAWTSLGDDDQSWEVNSRGSVSGLRLGPRDGQCCCLFLKIRLRLPCTTHRKRTTSATSGKTATSSASRATSTRCRCTCHSTGTCHSMGALRHPHDEGHGKVAGDCVCVQRPRRRGICVLPICFLPRGDGWRCRLQRA
jgi:hypothetical protein